MQNTFKYIVSALAVTLFTSFAAFAQDDKGAVANKTVTANTDGTYTLTLEAYATGETVTTVTNSVVPTDFVVAYTMMGSMNGNMSDNVKRFTALKQAIQKTLQLIQDENNQPTDGGKHRIGLVEYQNSSTAPTVVPLTTDYASVNTIVDAFNASGNSDADPARGLAAAGSMFSNDPDRAKVLIYIEADYSNYTLDYQTVKDMINAAYSLKSNDISVFTIGIYDKKKGGYSKDPQHIDKYMRLVSSEFPTARYDEVPTASSLGQGYDFSKTASHYFSPDNTSELVKVFDTITKSYTSGGTVSELTATTSSMRDFVTPQFKVVGDASDVKVYTVDAVKTNKTADVKWESRVPVTTYTGAYDETKTGVAVNIVKAADNTTEVVIAGFDYKANFVHKDLSNRGAINGWDGKKLVVEIKIEFDPTVAGDGGFVFTNTDDSGLYSGSTGQEASFNPTGIDFPVPVAVVPMDYLHITKDGLKKGESAIFDVEDEDGGQKYTVMVTNDIADGETAHAYVYVQWLKDLKSIEESALTTDKMVKFTVTEQSWTWKDQKSYDEPGTKVLRVKENGVWVNKPFEFGYDLNDKGLKNDETSTVIVK